MLTYVKLCLIVVLLIKFTCAIYHFQWPWLHFWVPVAWNSSDNNNNHNGERGDSQSQISRNIHTHAHAHLQRNGLARLFKVEDYMFWEMIWRYWWLLHFWCGVVVNSRQMDQNGKMLSHLWSCMYIVGVKGGGYRIYIRWENPTSWTGIEPTSSNIGDKLAWPRACAASDPLSYRPPQIIDAVPKCFKTSSGIQVLTQTQWSATDLSPIYHLF